MRLVPTYELAASADCCAIQLSYSTTKRTDKPLPRTPAQGDAAGAESSLQSRSLLDATEIRHPRLSGCSVEVSWPALTPDKLQAEPHKQPMGHHVRPGNNQITHQIGSDVVHNYDGTPSGSKGITSANTLVPAVRGLEVKERGEHLGEIVLPTTTTYEYQRAIWSQESHVRSYLSHLLTLKDCLPPHQSKGTQLAGNHPLLVQ